MHEKRSDFSRVISRREFLKLAGLTGAGALLSACFDYDPTPTSRPIFKPNDTPTPYPTLIPATPENIPTTIPHVSIITRHVGFEDATSILSDPSYIYPLLAPKERDSDWFEEIEFIDKHGLKHPEKNLHGYFSSREQKLYAGFGHAGRDEEILGWKKVGIGGSKLTDVGGKFGYHLSGAKHGGDPKLTTQHAFVFVDIPNSRKTFFKYDPHEGGRFDRRFEFAISNQANALAINQRGLFEFFIPPDLTNALTIDQRRYYKESSDIHILDTGSWRTLNYVQGADVRGMQISEDGRFIFSQRGDGEFAQWSSKIIDATTKQVEAIRWPTAGSIQSFVVSPNFKYISTVSSTGSSNYGIPRGISVTYVKTPHGFTTVDGMITKITNHGLAYLGDGKTVRLP